jgi:hypothetical protein
LEFAMSASAPPPIVIEAGKASKKEVKRLKQGEGNLAAQVAAALDMARSELGSDAEGKVLVPVAVLYKRKPRRPKNLLRAFRL